MQQATVCCGRQLQHPRRVSPATSGSPGGLVSDDEIQEISLERFVVKRVVYGEKRVVW